MRLYINIEIPTLSSPEPNNHEIKNTKHETNSKIQNPNEQNRNTLVF
ncbi:hypothetical protein KsCSTR_03140 [Candidatus Kuenenia stuttgartiensis]|uniref:Uncharacterized protein n=1 Tax=Kuenenia stuttgartiensis TaxID=174633 RepID=A0A6G7GK54_KUEST|nr:hypothetical protein KsCSTR_03140 [Candidatus Kuenenia stuttgartiensis]